MFKDLLLIVLVSVVWKSVHGTYIVNENDNFELFSDSRLGPFHYTSPHLDSPLYRTHFPDGIHDDSNHHGLLNFFSDRFRHQPIETFPRLFYGRLHNSSPHPHLAALYRSSQQYANLKTNNHLRSSHLTKNLQQEQIENVSKDRGQSQNRNHDLHNVAQVTVPAFGKSDLNQGEEQDNYSRKSQSIKTVQARIENDDEPRYINNGFRPVSEPKRDYYVTQQNISPGYNSKNNNTSNYNYKLLHNFPAYDDESYPVLYDQSHQGYLGDHVQDNHEYSILPVQVTSGEGFNLHGLNGINLPLGDDGQIDFRHPGLRLIKLNGDILKQLSNGVAEGLSNFINSNQGQLVDYENDKNNGSKYESPKDTEPYSGKKSDIKTTGVEQKAVGIGLKSIAETYRSLDKNAKSYEDIDKLDVPDYPGAKIIPVLNLEQKSLDVGVKTNKDSKTPYNAEPDQPKDSDNLFPTKQIKVPDVEQKSVNIDLKGNPGDSNYPSSDYGNSKTNTEQKSVEIDYKSSLGDSNAYVSQDDSSAEYDGIGSIDTSKYKSNENKEIKVEQKSVLEEKIYKDISRTIKTSQKDLAISSIGELSKEDTGYKSEGKNSLKNLGHEAQSTLKAENEPFSGGKLNYGNIRPPRNGYAQRPRYNSPIPSLGVSRYPSRSSAQPNNFGNRYFNSGAPISTPGSTYATGRQRPSSSIDSPSPRLSYAGQSRPANFGRARQFQITPGYSGNGAPRPPVYSEVRSIPTQDEAPKYKEPVPRRTPPSRYPAFPSGRADLPNPETTSHMSRGPSKPLNYGKDYQQNLGGVSNPSSVDYSSVIGAVEYPGIGEKASHKPSGTESGSYARPRSPINQERSYNKEPAKSSIAGLGSKPSAEEYPGTGDAGSPPYSKSEVVGGRYPVQRSVKSSVKTAEPELSGTKTKQNANTEQKYLPITEVLSDNKDKAPASKIQYGSVKTPARPGPKKVEQQQEADLEYEALLAGPGSQSNAVGSSGFGFNTPPAINVGFRDSPLGSGDTDQNLPPMPYEFEFDVQDDEHGSQYRQEKMDDNGYLTGRYGFRDPAGVFRQVEYEASKDGFKVNKIRTNEPGTDNQNPADVQYDVVNNR